MGDGLFDASDTPLGSSPIGEKYEKTNAGTVGTFGGHGCVIKNTSGGGLPNWFPSPVKVHLSRIIRGWTHPSMVHLHFG